MKRVLIITYYWPPNGGVGVQRWLKMSKYLPEHGWQPVVYTPTNPELVAEDVGLLTEVHPETEVIKRPITEPFGLYKRFTGKARDERIQTAFLSEQKRGGWKEAVALWVRSNFFVPDARIWWVNPSIRFLKDYLREHPVEAVVTTGPPHSMHLIGLGLKGALGVKWVADFRDPWTGIDFYQQLRLTAWADRRQRRLERAVLTQADQVVAVSWRWAKDLEALGAKHVHVITNGYDPSDVPVPALPVDEEFSLVHAGSMSATRDQSGLWRLLAAMCRRDADFASRFKLRFVGPVDHAVTESLRSAGLEPFVERMGRVTHAEAMRAIARARVLLLPINTTANRHGILPTKLYEYLSVGRPILAVGPADGDVARVLGNSHLLISAQPNDAEATRIMELFHRPASLTTVPDERFSRRVLAGAMAALLDGMAGRP
ncbi:MAG: glycosyltransferase [Flavobacteriales bacterium]|nr:glycosyltransferase [Flavobacteriales bacterium]